MSFYNSEHDDDETVETKNPFAPVWHERVLGPVLWIFEFLRFWLGWPIFQFGRLFAFLFAFFGWQSTRLTDAATRLRHRLMLGTIERLQLEGVRKKVQGMQDSAARSVDSLATSIGDHTVNAGWMGSLRRLFRHISHMVLGIWIAFMSWAERSWIARCLAWPLRRVWWISLALMDFALGWIASREYRHLLFGMPAILLLLPLVVCAVRIPFHSSAAKAKHYRLAADAALEEEDFASAELYFRKLTQLGNTHERVLWRAAIASADQGNFDRAYEQMLLAAPESEPGFGMGHVWIAESVSAGKVTSIAAADRPAVVETHLRHALKAYREAPHELHVWLAESLLSRGENPAALEELLRAKIERLPKVFQVRAADLYLRLGKTQTARRISSQLVRQYQQAGDSLTLEEHFAYGVAHELTGQFSQAIGILHQGALTFPESQLLSDAARDLTATYCQTLRPGMPAELRQIVDLLKAALELPATQHDPILIRLVTLMNRADVAEEIQQALDAYAQTKPLPVRVVRSMADMAIIGDDRDKAMRLYATVIERDASQHVAINNLAFLLGETDPPQLDRALELARKAVSMQPANPHYLETRGQILIKLQRWTEAVSDLDVALNGMPHKREIHASLALAHRKLGHGELSQHHAAQAKR